MSQVISRSTVGAFAGPATVGNIVLTAGAAADASCLVVDASATGELVTNGTFTGSATGWTLGSGWAYGTNSGDKTGDGTAAMSQAITVVAGQTYWLFWEVTSFTAGTSVTPSIGGTDGTAITGTGVYIDVITATNTTALKFTPTNTVRCVIDNVSVIGATVLGRLSTLTGTSGVLSLQDYRCKTGVYLEKVSGAGAIVSVELV